MTEPLFLNIDQWHDWLRVILFVSCLCSAVFLLVKYKRKSKHWNPKTKDYWYSLFMWCIAGTSYGLEGIIRDRPLGPTLMFVLAAAIVTSIGVKRKGGWGDGSA